MYTNTQKFTRIRSVCTYKGNYELQCNKVRLNSCTNLCTCSEGDRCTNVLKMHSNMRP